MNYGFVLVLCFHWMRSSHYRHTAASGLLLYVYYWFVEQQMCGARLSLRRRVKSLADTNFRGHYEGWFVYPMCDTLPWPQWDWDPDVVFKDMRMVARHGNFGIWRGSLERPQIGRASCRERVGQ